jgi:low affinity Fe/Cu permease
MTINKITAIIGTGLAIVFLLGLTVTLNKSNMIGFFDILPVYIIMGVSITMMLCEVLLQFGIHLDEKIEKKFRPFLTGLDKILRKKQK